MKVRLLPLAIGAAIAMPGVALADGPTVYGKMNVTLESVEDFGENDLAADVEFEEWQLNSNASRLGIKGSEEITDNLSVIYQAEYGINVDDGGSGGTDPFSQRNIFVGLEGGWGLFKAGKFDSPTKEAQGKIDQFNDMQFGDIGNVVSGEERVADSLQYSSPAIMDAITLNVAFQPGEDGLNEGDDGVADTFSASAVYSKDILYLALSMDDNIDGVDLMRFVAGLKLDVFELGFLYTTAEEAETAAGDPADEQEGYILSAGMKLGENNKLRAQYGYSDNDDIAPGVTLTTEVTQYGIGFDHSLSKQTKLFANYIALEEDDTVVSIEYNTFQLGMEHKF